MSRDLVPLQTNFNAPMHVTDMPIELSGPYPYDDVGWGFIKRAYRGAKRGLKKGARFARRTSRFIRRNPVTRFSRRLTPKFIRRGLSKAQRFARRAGRTAWRYAKKAAFFPIVLLNKTIVKLAKAAVKAIIKRIVGRGVRKIAARRARFMSYRRRGSTRPTGREKAEALRWARKYIKSKGWLGKIYGAATKRVVRDKRVRRAVAQKLKRARRARAAGYDVGAAATGTAAITAIAVPVIIALVNKLVSKAMGEGAPADPRQAAPEQVLRNQIQQQAGQMVTQYFQPPSEFQAAVEPPPRPMPPPMPPPAAPDSEFAEYYPQQEVYADAYGPDWEEF